MNFGHLAVFHAVARTRHVGRAAEQLLISQPAVSKQLKELERSLSTTLFDRHPKGMRPTAAGETLAVYAQRIFALADEAERAMDELRGVRRGRLVVGASTTIGVYLLPDLFVRFRELYPGIKLDLEIAGSEVIRRRLLEGEMHLGLTEGIIVDDEIETVAFAKDRLVAIASPNHPMASMRSVTARALCREPFVVRETGSGTKSMIESALAHRGLSVSAAMSLGSTEAIKRAVAAGVGVAIVSERAIALELKTGQLVRLAVSDLKIERKLYRLTCRGRVANPATTEFMRLLSERLHN